MFDSDSGNPGKFNRNRAAFTLMEMLAVMMLMAIVITPLCLRARSAGDVTDAVNTVAGLLETAASYSRANNTYVWVGFFEENSSAAPSLPAQSGTGRIVVSVVASKDGTPIVDASGPGTPIDSARLIQVCKLTKIENMHLADVPSPVNPDASGGAGEWDARPEVRTAHVTYRIGETSPNRTSFPFRYPVGITATVSEYNFVKTVRFSPDGEALLNTSYSLVPWIEVGFQPANGIPVNRNCANVAAIQVSGVSGSIEIYRR